jgi:hypothetical protein
LCKQGLSDKSGLQNNTASPRPSSPSPSPRVAAHARPNAPSQAIPSRKSPGVPRDTKSQDAVRSSDDLQVSFAAPKKSPGRDLRKDELTRSSSGGEEMDASKSVDVPKFSGHRSKSPRPQRVSLTMHPHELE